MKVRLIAALGAAGVAATLAAAVGTTAATSVRAAGGLPIPTPTAVALPVAPPSLPPAPPVPTVAAPVPTAPVPVPTLPVPTPTLPVPTPPVPLPTLLPGPTSTPTTPTPTPTSSGNPQPTPTPSPSGGGGNTGGGNTGGSTGGGSTGGSSGGSTGGSSGGSPGGGSTGGGTTGGGSTGGGSTSGGGGGTVIIPQGVGGGTLTIPQAVSAASATRSVHVLEPGALVAADTAQNPLDELTLSVDHSQVAPGGTDQFTAILTVGGHRVPDAAISMALISSPGQDASVSPQSGMTDVNGVLQGVLHLSGQPGDHLLLAWSGAYSDEVHVMGQLPVGANSGGGLPFGLNHLGILKSPVVLWLAAITGAVVALGVLVNLGLLRRRGVSISVRRLMARRRAARTA